MSQVTEKTLQARVINLGKCLAKQEQKLVKCKKDIEDKIAFKNSVVRSITSYKKTIKEAQKELKDFRPLAKIIKVKK